MRCSTRRSPGARAWSCRRSSSSSPIRRSSSSTKGGAARGDAGFVAEEDGRPVGAVWWRFFTDDEHGEGYIDADTPELAIAVVDGYRGRGIGRTLMEAMHEHGRQLGLRRVSLSVDPDNPAKRLYVSLGYVEYEPGDENDRMILEL